MDNMIFRSIKSVVLFFVMFLSLRFLGIPDSASIIVSLIPLVLGILDVMTGAAYGIAALFFVFAAFSALIPAKHRNAVDFIEHTFKDVSFDRQSTVSPPAKEAVSEPSAKPKPQ
jgi:hypothetical protein